MLRSGGSAPGRRLSRLNMSSAAAIIETLVQRLWDLQATHCAHGECDVLEIRAVRDD